VSMTGTIDRVEVITSVQRRRRWSVEEKAAMVQETYAAGMSVSLVARQHGVAPNQLFRWRRLYAEGALSAVGAGEEVVPASEYRALQSQVRELQRLLGKKTLENEILREALDRRGDGALVWPTRVRARHPERIGDRLHGVSSRAGEGARNRVASKSGWTHKPVVQAGTNERPIFVA
jgi:transposase